MKKKELMLVKLLFITKVFLALYSNLNKRLLTLQRRMFSSVPASKLLGVWN
jgi:hypothetical protein